MIIDEPVEKVGKLKIYEWEAWIDDADIRRYIKECGGSLNIISSLQYEHGKNDGLFRAWIVHKS